MKMKLNDRAVRFRTQLLTKLDAAWDKFEKALFAGRIRNPNPRNLEFEAGSGSFIDSEAAAAAASPLQDSPVGVEDQLTFVQQSNAPAEARDRAELFALAKLVRSRSASSLGLPSFVGPPNTLGQSMALLYSENEEFLYNK